MACGICMTYEHLGMNENEILAYEILRKMGWEPIKTRSEVGNPDFKCSNKRCVEVKAGTDSLSEVQVKRCMELQKHGYDVFIMHIYKIQGQEPFIDFHKLNFVLSSSYGISEDDQLEFYRECLRR